MPIPDKVSAAHKINDLLNDVIAQGGFKLKYRITVDPKIPDSIEEPPEILVELGGVDSGLVLDRGAELLRSFELITQEMLRLGHDEHSKVSFDCRGFRAARQQELRASAEVAAERVRKSGTPYEFSPMSSRERRILHLALRAQADLKTESAGVGSERCVVLYPKDYKPFVNPRPMGRR